MRHPNINKNMHRKQMFKGQKNLPKNVKLLAWLEYVILILRIWPTNPNYKIIKSFSTNFGLALVIYTIRINGKYKKKQIINKNTFFLSLNNK